MTMVQLAFWEAVKLVLLMCGLLYISLVIAGYVMEGPRYHPRFRLAEPARSGERLLIWTGIKILHAVIRFFQFILNLLFTASAEVGLWIINKSGPKVQREVRSHFL